MISRKIILLLCVCLSLLSCSGMSLSDFENKTPKFSIEKHFTGSFVGHGGFFDRFGKLRRTFTLILEGSIEGDSIILDEELRYADGEILHRKYTIVPTGENTYSAVANGVIGEATIEARGNALRWDYTLAQEIGDSVWNLSFDDWMFLFEDGTILNRAEVFKWGVKVGEVQMVLAPQPKSSVK